MFIIMPTAIFAEEEYQEIAGPQSFKKYLEMDGDITIKLVSNIIHTTTASAAGKYWITLGKGKKILDLNGYSAELNAETGSETTMIRIPEGSELIVNDSSGNNSGKLFCYGRMDNPGQYGIYYSHKDVKYRNVVYVDGGSLTVNGGTLEAGRSKELWLVGGMDIAKYKYQLDYMMQGGTLGWAIGARYDGYAWQQVNGDCITLDGGNVTINDGVFLGRGFSEMDTSANATDILFDFERSAVIRASSGELIINGGEFQGRGNADVFSLPRNAFNGGEVTGKIKSGIFKTNHLRVINIPHIETANNKLGGFIIGLETNGEYNPASDPGSVRFPYEALNSEIHEVTKDGKELLSTEWTAKNLYNTDDVTTIVVNSKANSNWYKARRNKNTDKEISSAKILGTMANGIELNASTLKCTDTGVKNIKTTWYHNGALIEDEQEALSGNYSAMATLTAGHGYKFTDSTKFVIMGKTPEKVTISDDGKYAYVWSKEYEFECDHSYNTDSEIHYEGAIHYQQCSVCGEKILEENHTFDGGESFGNITTYTCTTCGYTYDEENNRIALQGIIIDVPVATGGDKIPIPVVTDEYSDYAKIMSYEWHVGSADGELIDALEKYEDDEVYYLIARAKANDGYYFKNNAIMACAAVAKGTSSADDDVLIGTFRIVAHQKVVAKVYMPAMNPGMTMEDFVKGIESEVANKPTSNFQISVKKYGEDDYYFVKRNPKNEWSLYNDNGTLEEFFRMEIDPKERYELELGFSTGKYYVADDAITFVSDAAYEGYKTEGGDVWYTVYVLAQASSNVISDVSIVDVAMPEIGATPDNTFSVSNSKVITPALGEWDVDERFEEGVGYVFTAKVELEDGYKFAKGTTATVNHEPADIVVAGNTATITYTAPELEKAEEIEVVKEETGVQEEQETPEEPVEEGTTWSKASSWAVEFLDKANKHGIMPAIFKGEDLTKNITRKEFAHVAVKLYEKLTGQKAIPVAKNPFTDTDDIEILKAYNIGITSGTSATTFTPDALITREQMARMIENALTKSGIDTTVDLGKVEKFADDDLMNDWSRNAIYFMSSKDIIKGMGNNLFGVRDNATREQSMIISEKCVDTFSK
jgi:hypothetical protein